MISRRGFLVGTLTATAGAAGAAILHATPDEVAAFGKPLVGPVSLFQPDRAPSALDMAGSMVFDRTGRAIGIVSRMEISNGMHDVTSWDSSVRSYASGLLHVRYEVDGTGYEPMRFL